MPKNNTLRQADKSQRKSTRDESALFSNEKLPYSEEYEAFFHGTFNESNNKLDYRDMPANFKGMTEEDKIKYNYVRDKIVNLALGAGIAIFKSALPEALFIISGNEAADRDTSSQSEPSLPEKARITYAERQNDPKLAGLNIIDFLRAEYGPWLSGTGRTGQPLKGTLSRPELKRIDPSAYMALSNWLRTNQLPEDLYLPTKAETVNLELTSFDGEEVRRSRRLLSAQHRRQTRKL